MADWVRRRNCLAGNNSWQKKTLVKRPRVFSPLFIHRRHFFLIVSPSCVYKGLQFVTLANIQLSEIASRNSKWQKLFLLEMDENLWGIEEEDAAIKRESAYTRHLVLTMSSEERTSSNFVCHSIYIQRIQGTENGLFKGFERETKQEMRHSMN